MWMTRRTWSCHALHVRQPVRLENSSSEITSHEQAITIVDSVAPLKARSFAISNTELVE